MQNDSLANSLEKYPLTAFIDKARGPFDCDQYQKQGGYQSTKELIKSLKDPKEVQKIISDSGLKGRGGAGFSTGFKMSAVPLNYVGVKYLVCNADEMEPGTFKDRLLLEESPHLLIEGMILAAFAVRATKGYIFLRGEYKKASNVLHQALHEAYHHKLLGKNILGTDFSFDLHVHMSAGRYICGEETALINALEGKRANPRAKPPFPQVSGLWGKPTLVQNCETLCNLPAIFRFGADWYKKLGLGEDAGTKLYGVSGRVKTPAIWELPMGTPMREILMKHAGGMKDGYKLKAFLPGGASTDFMQEHQLDIPMNFTAMGKAGYRMGTGTMIVLDDKTCPIGMILNLEKFFRQESCGFCTPCRDGLPWVVKLLMRIESGQGKEEDIKILEQHVKLLGPGYTFCALAPGAMSPLGSGLKVFMDEFKQHMQQKRCSYRV